MNGTDIEMAQIAGGAVQLHDARRKQRWTVELEPFELGVFAVTQEQAAELIGLPSPHPRRPVTGVSWLRAVRFCNAASEWEGRDPAYTFDGEDVTWHVDADGFRLPTEAEWEFACRAGSTGAHYGPLAEVAWTSADGLSAPADVGGRLPNLNGLFDTLGNTWEWWLGPPGPGAVRRLPGVPRRRVRRRRVECARGHAAGRPAARPHEDVGFRVARGGFDAEGAAQGWSLAADRERAAVTGPLPSGWTPRR